MEGINWKSNRWQPMIRGRQRLSWAGNKKKKKRNLEKEKAVISLFPQKPTRASLSWISLTLTHLSLHPLTVSLFYLPCVPPSFHYPSPTQITHPLTCERGGDGYKKRNKKKTEKGNNDREFTWSIKRRATIKLSLKKKGKRKKKEKTFHLPTFLNLLHVTHNHTPTTHIHTPSTARQQIYTLRQRHQNHTNNRPSSPLHATTTRNHRVCSSMPVIPCGSLPIYTQTMKPH